MIKYYCDITGKEVERVTDLVHTNTAGVKTQLSHYLELAFPDARHMDIALREKLQDELPDYIASADKMIVESIRSAVK